mmetsp:Transcript_7534/g.12663  ORF Transcript_7534/g.12663 Transcript_7534/m.12663 type:complete len:119 (-) Transcript_7534:159-515(-)
MMRLNRFVVPLRTLLSTSPRFSTTTVQTGIPNHGLRLCDAGSMINNSSRNICISNANSTVSTVISSKIYLFASRALLSMIDNALWLSSTLKKRRSKMNKHKLRKRKKLMRKNTKQSRN